MSILLRCFSIFLIIAYFLLIFYLLKRKKFSLRYSLLWLFSGLIMLILVIFPDLLVNITRFFGIEIASNGLFAMCIFLIVMILVLLTVIVSDLTYRIKKLSQVIAIAEKRLRALEALEREDR